MQRVARLATAASIVAATACSAGGASSPGDGNGDDEGNGGEGGMAMTATGGAPPATTAPVTGGAPPATTAPVTGGAPPAAGGAPPAMTAPPPVTTAPQVYPYDTNVRFDWPETTPGAGGTCKAGRYEGAFAGTYVSPATFIGFPVPVSGNVVHTLQESASGEFFEIADGTVEGLANGTFPFSSGFRGTLNCSTGQLENAYLPQGTYNALGTNYFFEGPVCGTYDKILNAFNSGIWAVGEPTLPPGQCPQLPVPSPWGGSGTWSSQWAGP